MRDIRGLESLERIRSKELQGFAILQYEDSLQSTTRYSVSGRHLRNYHTIVWKSFHSVVDAGLSGVFELARDVHTRGHTFKVAIPVCHTDVGKRIF